MILINNEPKKFTGGRVKSLCKFLTHDRINKLESVDFNISGLTKEIADNSNLTRLRKKLGSILSLEGRAAMVILPHMNSYILDVMRVSYYDVIGKYEKHIIGTTGAVHIKDGTEFTVYTEYKYINGKPHVSSYYIDDDGEKNMVRIETSFDTDFLPVELFFNNEDRTSDIEYAGAWEDLERLSYFDTKQRAEWERTRTLPSFNTMFSDKDPGRETIKIDNGQGYIEEDSMNSKYGAGQSIIPATAGTQYLQSQIVFLEDDLYKKLGLKRDSVSTGTNKTILEIINMDEHVIEHLMSVKQLREKHWQQFFDKIGKLVGEQPVINLEFSKVLDTKIKLYDSMLLEAEIGTKNKQSQIDKGE